MLDLTTLSDNDLADHLNAVLAEQERRQRLTTIPEAVRSLADQYTTSGGDLADLTAVLSD